MVARHGVSARRRLGLGWPTRCSSRPHRTSLWQGEGRCGPFFTPFHAIAHCQFCGTRDRANGRSSFCSLAGMRHLARFHFLAHWHHLGMLPLWRARCLHQVHVHRIRTAHYEAIHAFLWGGWSHWRIVFAIVIGRGLRLAAVSFGLSKHSGLSEVGDAALFAHVSRHERVGASTLPNTVRRKCTVACGPR